MGMGFGILPKDEVGKRTKPKNKGILAPPLSATPYGKASTNPARLKSRVVSCKVALGIAGKFKGVKMIAAYLIVVNGNPLFGERVTHGIIHIFVKQVAMGSNINTKGNRRSIIHDVLKIVNAIGVDKLFDIVPNRIPTSPTNLASISRPRHNGLHRDVVTNLDIND